MLFDQLVIANIKETNGYSTTLADMRRVILQTKAEFKALLSNYVGIMLCEGEGNI